MIELNGILSWIQSHPQQLYLFLGTIGGYYVLRGVAIAKLQSLASKTDNTIDDLIVSILHTLRAPFAVGLAFFFVGVTLEGTASMLISVVFAIVATKQAIKIEHTLFEYIQDSMEDSTGAPIIDGFKTILDIVVWSLGFVMILSIFGYNVTSIVAGLGIGGIAIALALQNLLGDVLSSLSIYFDKPFKIGDYIVRGDYDGVVEKIGLKTTRVRSLRGEQLIIANKDLTSNTVSNFGNLERRRVLVNIGVAYDTSSKKIDVIPKDIERIINSIDGAEFSRMHFKEFGDSALIQELVYYINSNDYDVYIRAQHAINTSMKNYFEDKQIEIAYPTQTIFSKSA